MSHCMYLRKSRADMEAEAQGEGETLTRHEKTLLSLARKAQLNVTKIYREIVSGETIAARPMMQQLLADVEEGVWQGVLVVEVERLARGDTMDQGLVAQTFKYSDTKIITPTKTYDPNDEFDEEYFEFGLFMSRREYKTINRRLQRGRLQSIKEGKYVGNIPPFGYIRKKLDEPGYTLEPHPEESQVVKLIYDWFTGPDQLGTSDIPNRLNELKIPTRKGGGWTPSTIRGILTNPVYIGKIRWGARAQAKEMANGGVSIKRPRADNPLVVDGLHEAIISDSVFEVAQTQLAGSSTAPVPGRRALKNPLAGIIVCGVCGRKMLRRPYQKNSYPDTLLCPGPTCPNISSQLDLVEKRLLQALASWLHSYKIEIKKQEGHDSQVEIDLIKKVMQDLNGELKTLNTQLGNLHDLLEQGVYSVDVFLQRSKAINDRIKVAESDKEQLENELKNISKKTQGAEDLLPRVERVVDAYWQLPTTKQKNDLLKEVLDRVIYVKKEDGRRNDEKPDGFRLSLYPKIPK